MLLSADCADPMAMGSLENMASRATCLVIATNSLLILGVSLHSLGVLQSFFSSSIQRLVNSQRIFWRNRASMADQWP